MEVNKIDLNELSINTDNESGETINLHNLEDIQKLLNEYMSNKQQLVKYENIFHQQIDEIHQLKEKLVGYRFYKKHPKDEYLINFGHKYWRAHTYRYIATTRRGRVVIDWVLKKTTPENMTKNKHILEFKQYLIDIGFKQI